MTKTPAAFCLLLTALLFQRLAFPPLACGYEPPIGGETLLLLGHPALTAGAASTAGNLLWQPFKQGGSSVGPAAITVNPALTANNQRFTLDTGYTGLFQTEGDFAAAHYVHIGSLFPTRYGAFSAALRFNAGQVPALDLGQAILAAAGFGRDITQNLYVGAAVSGGYNFNETAGKSRNDWALFAKIGFVYRLGDLGPLQESAVAVTVSQLGKPFGNGTSGWAYPSLATPQVGYSAIVLDETLIRGGFSVDLSFPIFQNLVLDAAIQIEIARAVLVSVGYKINIHETLCTDTMHLPFIGLSWNFTAGMGKSGVLVEQGWERSDIGISAVWDSLYGGAVQLISAGAVLNMGGVNTAPPQILIEDR
ncbi:MAG: hypothetical protein LBD20_07460 [Spirochaetaceae bacterium]|nr:hypothetical protein [Spirochaetaceae bacterium]